LLGRLWRGVERLVLTRSAYKFVLRQWTAPKDIDAAADVMATLRLSRTLKPVEMAGPRAGRLLVVAPHPDDEMIGPGGTVIRAIDAGAAVTVLYLTRGEGGRGETRRREAETVARRIGYATADLSVAEGALDDRPEIVARFAEVARAVRPEAILLPFLLDDHPEHRVASRIFMRAWGTGTLPPCEVWAYQVYTTLVPNVIVDTTASTPRKAEAIRLWKESAMLSRDWAHYALGRDAYTARFLERPPGPWFAEGFVVLPAADYAALCRRYFTD